MITLVVPVLNEAGSLPDLLAEIAAAAPAAAIAEVLFVDDGSTDDSLAILRARQAGMPSLRVLIHERRMGQSAAFLSGARAAKEDVLVFMDGDGQNDPADIARLAAAFREAGRAGTRAAVLGQRAERRDTWIRRVSSRLANAIRSRVLKDGTRDTGCSLKLIRRADYLALPYFDHMHRFLPALLQRDGVALAHVAVSHRPRLKGQSKYGFWNRALVGAVDLAGVAWLIRRKLPADWQSSELSRPDEVAEEKPAMKRSA